MSGYRLQRRRLSTRPAILKSNSLWKLVAHTLRYFFAIVGRCTNSFTFSFSLHHKRGSASTFNLRTTVYNSISSSTELSLLQHDVCSKSSTSVTRSLNVRHARFGSGPITSVLVTMLHDGGTPTHTSRISFQMLCLMKSRYQ
ncbi:unnamed protein product [Clavelina lepadiformis]|uniref:Uncharacterized protein n=1 Tax=Clavelina lepadiformis TaxID=159417 RepID=A0ABP0H2E9_CLALP